MDSFWLYTLLASLLLHFLLALTSSKLLTRGFERSANDDRYVRMGDHETSFRSAPWRSNPQFGSEREEPSVLQAKDEGQSQNAELLIELGYTLGLDDETIRLRQLKSRPYNHPLLAMIEEHENPYSELETIQRNRERQHQRAALEKQLTGPTSSWFDYRWSPKPFDLESAIKQIDPEFYYTKYRDAPAPLQIQTDLDD